MSLPNHLTAHPTAHTPITVHIVSADVNAIVSTELHLTAGQTVKDALIDAKISVNPHDVGLWGKRVALDTPLKDGDRIELYRPIIADAKAARLRRASEQGYRWLSKTRRAARVAK